MKKLISYAGIASLAAGLTACGGGGAGGGGSTTIVTPPPPSATAKYGAKFDAAFKADANSDPAEVVAGDVVAVDATAEPTPL
ncbi:hypothetical protein [Asticcacaulis sp. W401b]|uniref:hypothetical protein n=1 Tax=Asticcacaulis sp. W401b TaxID=3388666 RepID=UPI0039711262